MKLQSGNRIKTFHLSIESEKCLHKKILGNSYLIWIFSDTVHNSCWSVYRIQLREPHWNFILLKLIEIWNNDCQICFPRKLIFSHHEVQGFSNYRPSLTHLVTQHLWEFKFWFQGKWLMILFYFYQMENRGHTIKLIFRNINRTTDLHLFWLNMSLICI